MTEIISILQQVGTAMFSTSTESPGIVVTFFTWLTSAEVLPFVGISLAITLIMLAIRVVRSSLFGM